MRTIPMLSSLRHMFIKLLVPEASANIVAYCPNLTTLELGCQIKVRKSVETEEDDPAHLSLLTKDAWPSIHELDCSRRWSTSFTDCLGRAGKVTIHDAHLDHHEHYLPILRKTRPFFLRLMNLRCNLLDPWPSMDQFETEQDLVKYAWKEVANTLPQLRSLVLGLYHFDLTVEFVNMLLDALRPLPLAHLSLHAPEGPVVKVTYRIIMANENKRRTDEVRRVDTLRALPDILPRALPHLRVFSLLGCKTILKSTDRRGGRSVQLRESGFYAAIEAQDAVDEEWGEMSSQVDEHLRELRQRADGRRGFGTSGGGSDVIVNRSQLVLACARVCRNFNPQSESSPQISSPSGQTPTSQLELRHPAVQRPHCHLSNRRASALRLSAAKNRPGRTARELVWTASRELEERAVKRDAEHREAPQPADCIDLALLYMRDGRRRCTHPYMTGISKHSTRAAPVCAAFPLVGVQDPGNSTKAYLNVWYMGTIRCPEGHFNMTRTVTHANVYTFHRKPRVMCAKWKRRRTEWASGETRRYW
ncbi:uncharacterized protein BXZ73DRAFT_79955 [Epithele typhae]|uniref:uncharacterized protein n=1 Tax=Epithele typhae TaxID=378194 RepID=UPI002007B65B|nr:uncharacterized protein BXZ73DRAFT_79955 [Epithele typhae]KAH9921173.1 hypothetical protein BXZ73DRAFT_79955 [Epithele typhae]